MSNNIEIALNELYQRQITSRDQLLNEMLRVKMTLRALGDQPNLKTDKETLFQLMKNSTEETLGFFPADRDDFLEIFDALKAIEINDFALAIYKNDRLGVVVSPHYLTTYIRERVKRVEPHTILITEAEKHLAGLQEFVDEFKNCQITLTTQHNLMNKFLNQVFGEYPNVNVVFESIYTECLLDTKFDYIYSLPAFGYKPDEIGKGFMTKDSDGIAMESMLGHLNEDGVLDIIIPAKITFAAQGYENLRAYIVRYFQVKNIYILPEGTFRPTTSIKTYLFTIAKDSNESIEVGTMEVIKDRFEVKEPKTLPKSDFLAHEDWRIELLLSDDDDNIQKFKNSNLDKVKLKEVAEVFRGKSILKKDTTVGSVGVLNISNIENGEINYTGMDTIEEEERKVKRYELEEGDVVLSCRGTAIKTAVFHKQEKTIIASANLIVIRTKATMQGDYIKIFLESPIGLAMIKSFQRGTTIMNINHSDIMEMEIPRLEIEQQHVMIKQYKEEHESYKKAVQEAEKRWNNVKSNVYNQLI
ncbi:restriction endonuclease subunit S [Paenibacillus sp. BR2-3]|uniref:restriction endonuclease subunit S n=1 Tax=Paenibacillus sp. BR2-3 TaxID=3048494 RepID=UPI0039773385